VKLYVDDKSASAAHSQCRCPDHERTSLAEQDCRQLTVRWTVIDAAVVLCQLRQIRHSFQMLMVSSLVLTCLDFGCSSSLFCPPTVGTECSCATDVSSLPIDHITDALVCLYWLRVPEWVQFKIAVLMYKVFYRLAPQNLSLLNHVADLPGRRSLRSAGTSHLEMPPVRLSTVANRAFPVAGLRIWNNLSVDVMFAELSTVRQWLKNPSLLKIILQLFHGHSLTFQDIS